MRAAPEDHVLRVCGAVHVPGICGALPRVVHVDQPAQLRQQQRLRDMQASLAAHQLMTEHCA